MCTASFLQGAQQQQQGQVSPDGSPRRGILGSIFQRQAAQGSLQAPGQPLESSPQATVVPSIGSRKLK